MISADDIKTLPVAIYSYLGFYGRDWGPLTAAAIISIVPVIAVFVFFQTILPVRHDERRRARAER